MRERSEGVAAVAARQNRLTDTADREGQAGEGQGRNDKEGGEEGRAGRREGMG